MKPVSQSLDMVILILVFIAIKLALHAIWIPLIAVLALFLAYGLPISELIVRLQQLVFRHVSQNNLPIKQPAPVIPVTTFALLVLIELVIVPAANLASIGLVGTAIVLVRTNIF